jgi:poly-gamma-glutamate synthesis protein (capsule biosynthesis protein)
MTKVIAMRTIGLVVFAIACGNTASTPQPTPTASPAPVVGAAPSQPVPPKPVTCEAGVPAAACKLQGGLKTCKADDAARVGEWRYAIEAPSFSPVEDLTSERFAELWKGTGKITLLASTETQAALEKLLGPGKVQTADGPIHELDATHFAIVPATELVPNWKVVTVDGKHPLDKAPGPLAVPLCGPDKQVAVRNVDPKKLTIIAMTGVTALTRETARLMNEKGVLYPLPAVEPWLAGADFVHISNEVSFVPKCDAGTKPTMSFCSKESYIELLEKSHAKIIELTGSHLTDYGASWFDHTLDMYKERNWVWFGGGHDQIEASAPAIVEHAGTKFAFLGCNMVRTTSHVIQPKLDTGACYLPRLEWQVRDLRKRGYTVIVSIQHEEVYVEDPPDVLVKDLREVAESGPAFVMGSQAHCPHPWEVHHGAYVHYGPGNFYFDQFWHPVRDAAQDRLYFLGGTLLTVGHLYTRIEERGRPRIMTEPERTGFLADMTKAQAKLPKTKPWEPPIEVPESRDRPDAIVVKGWVEPITVRVPAKLAEGKKYGLVVELGGPKDVATDDVFDVTVGKLRGPVPPLDKLGPAITQLVTAKFPIDPDQITLNTREKAKPTKKPDDKPKPVAKKK